MDLGNAQFAQFRFSQPTDVPLNKPVPRNQRDERRPVKRNMFLQSFRGILLPPETKGGSQSASSFLLLVRPGAPLVASLLLVAMPLFLVVMPGAPTLRGGSSAWAATAEADLCPSAERTEACPDVIQQQGLSDVRITTTCAQKRRDVAHPTLHPATKKRLLFRSPSRRRVVHPTKLVISSVPIARV